ncbi:MAG: DUF4105 domain-containing protein [Lunatimonas sp.]|uniref:Lnb N-terminal periplasmic domain-containing protein n=1 Tax=Lunatimonas sp. TaxID=2060141 RepID=UPI00263AEAF0|nr:DUF4105 domain-containing protein [Lunatimonas sp.]MCC5937362.1 DUF4105 domain-containing protein [Lunatimonas sp.]
MISRAYLLVPLIFLGLSFGALEATAQDYQISLITCDPGDELYSTFGHSAIRVLDKTSGTDLVYNYGTFDFNTPFFYVKFSRRTLDYQLALTTFEQFLYEYNYFKRSVREQVLDLSPRQTAEILQFLRINYQPENRKYRYDFFFDNCATRIRDMMESVLGNNLEWNEPEAGERKSFRQLIDEYVYPLPWSDLGIDLALGAVIDREAREHEKLFLPDYLEAAVARADVVGDGPRRSLVKETHVIYDFPDREIAFSLLNPYIILWVVAIFIAVITFLGFKRKKLYASIDIVLFGALGILGIVIVYLWFFTEHSQTKMNWNLLWAFPFHLLVAFMLTRRKNPSWLKKYLLFALIIADLGLILWLVGVQSFHPSVLPLLLATILRSNFLYYHLDKWMLAKN